MNATVTNFIQENGNGDGSDSDTNSADEAPEYYQPISGIDDGDSDGDSGVEFHQQLPNGNCLSHSELGNGISSLDLNDIAEQKSSDEEEEEEKEEEEEERSRAEEIRRAFREDESRRNAPLTAENATRVVEAMRGVSFGGAAPDWADQVPEDSWIDHLRRLRETWNT